jgi:hypothetical protein
LVLVATETLPRLDVFEASVGAALLRSTVVNDVNALVVIFFSDQNQPLSPNIQATSLTFQRNVVISGVRDPELLLRHVNALVQVKVCTILSSNNTEVKTEIESAGGGGDLDLGRAPRIGELLKVGVRVGVVHTGGNGDPTKVLQGAVHDGQASRHAVLVPGDSLPGAVVRWGGSAGGAKRPQFPDLVDARGPASLGGDGTVGTVRETGVTTSCCDVLVVGVEPSTKWRDLAEVKDERLANSLLVVCGTSDTLRIPNSSVIDVTSSGQTQSRRLGRNRVKSDSVRLSRVDGP